MQHVYPFRCFEASNKTGSVKNIFVGKSQASCPRRRFWTLFGRDRVRNVPKQLFKISEQNGYRRERIPAIL